eukprot:m.28816 g.28816  ORF g.28816 m.28816 type:complete len:578 (+) comp13653_c0_seq1:215-1948(+)
MDGKPVSSMLQLDDMHYSASVVDDGDDVDDAVYHANEFNGFGDEDGVLKQECATENNQVYYSIPVENSDGQESYEVPVLRASIVHGEAAGGTSQLNDSSASAERAKQAAHELHHSAAVPAMSSSKKPMSSHHRKKRYAANETYAMPLEVSTGVNGKSTITHRKNTQRSNYNHLTLPSRETGAVPSIFPDSTYPSKDTDRRYRRQNCVIALIFVLSLTAVIVALSALALAANRNDCSCGQPEMSAEMGTSAAQSAASSVGALQDQMNEVKGNVDDLNNTMSSGLSQSALALLSLSANVSRLDAEFFDQVHVLQTFVNDLEQEIGQRMALLEGSNISTSQLFLDKFVEVEVQIVSQNATLMSQINRVEQNFSNQVSSVAQSVSTQINGVEQNFSTRMNRVEQNFSSQVSSVEQSVVSWSQSMTSFTSQIGSAAACDDGIEAISDTGFVQCAPERNEVSPGVVVYFSGTNAPGGYLLCDGTSYLESQYPSLYGAIGRRYGGSSASRTFQLPDLVSGNRYLRAAGGSLAVGTEQDDATAANGMTVDLVVCQRVVGMMMRNAIHVCMRCVSCLDRWNVTSSS